MLLFLRLYLPTLVCSFFFFFNDPATTEIYTLSLHDALPISHPSILATEAITVDHIAQGRLELGMGDRKSTRLNSSHVAISYAVFCLKKKKKKHMHIPLRHSETRQTCDSETRWNATSEHHEHT